MARKMAVFCDETGTHHCNYFAWGSVWFPFDHIERVDQIVDALRIRHAGGLGREIKWSNSNHGASYRALVDWFFETPWICFQSLVVREDSMRIFGGGSSRLVAFKKLLCTLLTTQMQRFDELPGGPRSFSIFVDECSDTTRSMTEREFRILAATAAKHTGSDRDFVDDYRRIDSRSRRGIQIADLLVGALRASWEGGRPSGSKARTCQQIADHLGWPDLRGTTPPNLKFNVWLHRDSRDASPHINFRNLSLESRSGDPQRVFDRLEPATP